MATVKKPAPRSSKMSSKNDPISSAISLIGERRKSGEGRKTVNDVIGGIAQQSNESLGGSRRGWRSVAGGLTQGIKNAADLSSVFEREEDYKSHGKVLDYLESLNNVALENKLEREGQEKARLAVTPDYFAYDSAVKRGADPQTRLGMLQSMDERQGKITGNFFDFVDVSANDPNIGITRDGRVLNIPSAVFGEAYNEGAMASLDPDYQMRLQEERQRYDQELGLEERKVRSLEDVNRNRSTKLQAEVNRINNPYESPVGSEQAFNELEEVPLGEYDAVTRRGFVNDARNEVTASKEAQGALRILDELEQLSEKVPNISNLWTRNAPFGTLSAEQQNAIKKYEKYQSQIAQPLIRSRGSSVTDAERKIIEQGIPNWNQPLEARRDNIKTKKRELQTLIGRGIYAGNALARKVAPSQRGFEEFLAKNPNFVPEGVNPQFTQTSDFRNQNNMSMNEPYIIEDENGVEHPVTKEQYDIIQNNLRGAL